MRYNIVLFALIISNLSFANDKTASEIGEVKQKLFQLAMNKMYRDEDFSRISVSQQLDLLGSDGKFTDINYQNIDSGNWTPGEHWMRLYDLARLYQTKGAFFHDEALEKKIVNSITFWLLSKPKVASGWWNSIGLPLAMGKVFILMENEIPKDLIKKGIGFMNLGVLKDHYEYSGIATGQNLLWLTYVHVYSSCFANDTAGLHRAFQTSAKEIKITTAEGIQPDYSFHQHGPQFYSFGYGRTFSLTIAHLVYLAQNTSDKFLDGKIEIISHYILDGQQWATRNQFLEYTAMGREVSRSFSDVNSLLFATKIMSSIDKERSQEYLSFYSQLKNGYRRQELVGNRYFKYSDFMLQQRKQYYFSVKGASKRIIASESGNGENIKGYYQGNGTYYLTKTGKEYARIFPLLNWKQLPGSLVEQDTLPLPLIDFGRTNFGKTDFVYGVSDSLYGAFGYDYQKDNVKAKRAWFMFDKEIVCLVAGINYSSANPLYQTLNQCYAKGNVWINGKISVDNQIRSDKINSVYHDSVGYIFDSSHYLKNVSIEKRSGSWNDINKIESKDSITKNIFSLTIDLGKQLNNQSFSYVILPSVSKAEFEKYHLNNHVEILKNNATLQAVFQKDLKQVQAVFYTSGVLKLPWDKLWIKLNKPGLLLVKKAKNRLIIQLNPQLENKKYEVITNKKFLSPSKSFELLHRGDYN